MVYRKCFIPNCMNDTNNSPDKVIVRIREDLRERWCRESNVEYFKEYTQYCCEDHFDLAVDLSNYYKHKLMNEEPKLKPTATLKHSEAHPSVDLSPTKLGKIKHGDSTDIPSTSSYTTVPVKMADELEIFEFLETDAHLKRRQRPRILREGPERRSWLIKDSAHNLIDIIQQPDRDNDNIHVPEVSRRAPKTNAESCKTYYNRKKAANEAERIRQGLSVTKSIRKTGAERTRACRLRKKKLAQENKSPVTEILSVPSTSNSRMRTSEPSFQLAIRPSTNPEMCRICLRVDCRVYSMLEREDLRQAYQTLTGLTLQDEDALPPYLCAECSRRLQNCALLRIRSLRAQSVLLAAVRIHQCITLESVTSSMEYLESFGSDLTVEHNETDHYDLVIKHEDSDNCTDGQTRHGMILNRIKIEDDEKDLDNEETVNDRKNSPNNSEVDNDAISVKREPNDDFGTEQSIFNALGNNFECTTSKTVGGCVKTEINDDKDEDRTNYEMDLDNVCEDTVMKVEVDEEGNISMLNIEKSNISADMSNDEVLESNVKQRRVSASVKRI